jgi:hypothetical protein
MIDDTLPSNVPAYLQKDLLSTRHEVPVAKGGSHTVQENFYTPRLLRWALDQWLHSVPEGGNVLALERSLSIVCADSKTFHAYLQVPEAFEEVYLGEVDKQDVHRSEVASVTRVLEAKTGTDSRWALILGSALVTVIAIFTVGLIR